MSKTLRESLKLDELEAKQTPPSGAQEEAPKPEKRRVTERPWSALPQDGETGEYRIGKDGVTPKDFPWAFDVATGRFCVAGVEMKSKQNQTTGQYSRPRATGPIRSGVLPPFDFKDVETIYDMAEADGISLRQAVIKWVNPDHVAHNDMRIVAAGPDVFVMKSTKIREKKVRDDQLDQEIANLRNLK